MKIDQTQLDCFENYFRRTGRQALTLHFMTTGMILGLESLCLHGLLAHVVSKEVGVDRPESPSVTPQMVTTSRR